MGLREDFPARLTRYREARGYTQSSLAQAMSFFAGEQTSEKVVGNWEQGRHLPDLNKLYALCRVLGVTSDEFLGLDGRATEPVAAPGRDPLDAETDAVAATAPRRGATGQRRRGAGDATAG